MKEEILLFSNLTDRIGSKVILHLGRLPDGTKAYFNIVIDTDKGKVKKAIKTYINNP